MSRSFHLSIPVIDEYGHLEEQLYDDGESNRLFICAPHGAQVEPFTDAQAISLAERIPRSTCWTARGLSRGDAFDHWHISSNELDEEMFDLLPQVRRPCVR